MGTRVFGKVRNLETDGGAVIGLEARARVRDFFFAPASARPLAVLRIGLAACLLVQAYLLRGSIFELFSNQGLLQSALFDSTRDSIIPTVGLFTGFARVLHFDQSACILALCWMYSVCVLMFGLGYLNRFSAISTFFLHWILSSPSYATAYGFDLVAHVFLFYFVFLPAADVWSLDRYLHRAPARESSSARLGLRLLQFQLCLMILNSGIVKAEHHAWWSGEVLWRSLSLPIYQQYNLNALAFWPKLLMLAGWLILFVHLSFAVLIWPRVTRAYCIAGALAVNLGFAWFFGLGLYGALMSVLTIALFGISAEPASLGASHAVAAGWTEPVEPELMIV